LSWQEREERWLAAWRKRRTDLMTECLQALVRNDRLEARVESTLSRVPSSLPLVAEELRKTRAGVRDERQHWIALLNKLRSQEEP
jgi:hypothetical protein